MSDYYILQVSLDDDMPTISWGDEDSSGFYKNRAVEDRVYKLTIASSKSCKIGIYDMYWIGRPIVSSKIKDEIDKLNLKDSIQFVKAKIDGISHSSDYYIMHFIKKENCVDLNKSKTIYDEDGDIESVNNIILKDDFYKKDLKDRMVFKIKTDYVHHIVDKSIKEKIEKLGATGIRFINLEDWTYSSRFGGK